MKKTIIALVFAGILFSCNSTKKKNDKGVVKPSETITELESINSNEALIATALMAAPEESRAGCKVIGYNMNGEFVTFKEGTNEFIVLVDNPKQSGFNTACYHKDLEPFMARGRALRAEGKNRQEIFKIRAAEMKSGKLSIPTGATVHIYYGTKEKYDPKTSKVVGAQLRYVVYMPYATTKSTGLPARPIAKNYPWLMNPGTHRAHIMISPLPEEN